MKGIAEKVDGIERRLNKLTGCLGNEQEIDKRASAAID